MQNINQNINKVKMLPCMFNGCKNLEDLRIKCIECNQEFCKDHGTQESHCCYYFEKFIFQTCPICFLSLKIDSSLNVDQEISKHIDNGCNIQDSFSPSSQPKLSLSSKKFNCFKDGCNFKDSKEFICEYCKLNFCNGHQLASDHQCQSQPIGVPTIFSSVTSSLTSLHSPLSTSQVFSSRSTNSKNLTSNNSNDEKIYHEQKKQKNEISKIREEQKLKYHNCDECEIKVVQMNGIILHGVFKKTDTIKNVVGFINKYRNDGQLSYAICNDPNGLSPIQKCVPDLNLQQLNLVPSSILYMVSLEKIKLNNNYNNKNNNFQNNNVQKNNSSTNIPNIDNKSNLTINNGVLGKNKNVNSNSQINHNYNGYPGTFKKIDNNESMNIRNEENAVISFFNPVINFFKKI